MGLELNVVVATTKVRIFKQITTSSIFTSAICKLLLLPQRYVFSSKSQLMQLGYRDCAVVVATTKVRIFKQITTPYAVNPANSGCCCYHKGTYFQANHNRSAFLMSSMLLLLLPQRYVFSSKSQLPLTVLIYLAGCCCYHKGTYFQANHNKLLLMTYAHIVVVATTKVRIFKQITTRPTRNIQIIKLLLLPQRYVFSSKSQQ